ncbi:MAG TPA: cyclic nucleotide-binding domain-containing protein [Alphaproteobacteria bacterium]|jgi:CRP-like cAMP-binding protein|nr:cyclic nucleotide-binding domain-containing protein [Alphaproteobacteria bacterium]MDP6269879.1 cyclic nucleotide-binding domain-containing protein [Alphaproteobacteria bacterium]MDP7164315.1 cyclic nucleotide-binding domain-containing protein [Alphaproteobacteria bacterium]MDP7427637.1 cyclic nucleotide-binding domain-containing protein [Alphaproteobacteria bacterium]HJM48992.1 cyclic nucleotide-binding domain-containing protein [Alphaproteobacteria bacterium]
MFGRGAKSSSFGDNVEKEYQDGEAIVIEGGREAEMFIIQEGSARVTKTIGGEEVELAVLGRGDFFGDMSLLESLPRSATVRALGTTRVQVIQPGGLMLKFRRDPSFAFEMLQRLSGRVRNINRILVETLEGKHGDHNNVRAEVGRAEYEFNNEHDDTT